MQLLVRRHQCESFSFLQLILTDNVESGITDDSSACTTGALCQLAQFASDQLMLLKQTSKGVPSDTVQMHTEEAARSQFPERHTGFSRLDSVSCNSCSFLAVHPIYGTVLHMSATNAERVLERLYAVNVSADVSATRGFEARTDV